MTPFPLPHLSPPLAHVHEYWRSLLRGGADMPFSDDIDLSDLEDLADRSFLIDVFERPERFRFNQIGRALGAEALVGKFIDEVELKGPFTYLRSQSSATVESAAPSYFRSERTPQPYARLLLPFWGEGRIIMLMGAIDLE